MKRAVRNLLLLSARGRNVMTLTATTTASPENVIIDRMTPVGGNITIYWGDGSSTVQAPGDVASETHAYATAGTYQIRITPASLIQQVNVHRAQLSGMRSEQLARSPITYFICYSIGNAAANIVNSQHMAAWTPTAWLLYSMPAGAYTIDSQHMAGEQFRNVIVQAGRATGRTLRLIEMRGAAPDHPVLLSMRETEYLTCLVLEVD